MANAVLSVSCHGFFLLDLNDPEIIAYCGICRLMQLCPVKLRTIFAHYRIFVAYFYRLSAAKAGEVGSLRGEYGKDRYSQPLANAGLQLVLCCHGLLPFCFCLSLKNSPFGLSCILSRRNFYKKTTKRPDRVCHFQKYFFIELFCVSMNVI